MLKILLILILFAGILIGTFLVTSGRLQLFSKANEQDLKDLYPTKIIVTNVKPDSLTLSYFTPSKPVETKVSYGKLNNLDKTLNDDRDDINIIPRYTHYITLKGLEPETEYFVKIDNLDLSFFETDYVKVKTAKDLGGSGITERRFFGKIASEKGDIPVDTVAYLRIDDGQYLSTLVSNNGRWEVKIRNYLNKDLSSYLKFEEYDQVDVLAYSGLHGTGYYGTFVFGDKNESFIALEYIRVPFFKVQFSEPKKPANQTAQDIIESKKQGSGFFDILWSIFTGLTN